MTSEFKTPAEAVACLREYISLAHRDQTTFAEDARARAALESLEAEVGRLAEALDYNTNALIEQSRKVRALESELAEAKARVAGELPLRPAVAWFAQAMERKLRTNDRKGGWLDGKCDLLFLFEKLTEERRELTRATGERGTPEQILEEAADVGNIAMMIADVCQTVARPEGWDQPTTHAALDRGEADVKAAVSLLWSAYAETGHARPALRRVFALLGEEPPVPDQESGEAVAGELAEALRRVKLTVWEACSHHPEGEPDPALQALMRDWTCVESAARGWAALQWREPSTAPTPLESCLIELTSGFRMVANWSVSLGGEWCTPFGSYGSLAVTRWLPLDALPALPSEPVKP